MKINLKSFNSFTFGIILLITSFVWWICETIVFIMEYGWHYQPSNETEKRCDIIVMVIQNIGWIFIVIPIILHWKEKLKQK